MARARATHHGVLVIDKPEGPTSHDIVAWVRRALGERRVGHCGTLDPPASGVVVVAVGEATKLVAWLVDDDKVYDATIELGRATTTGDRDGAVIDARAVGEDEVRRAIAEVEALVGTHELSPPAVSAVRVEGVRAHARVRAGEHVVLPPRAMTVRHAEVLAHDLDAATIDVRLAVSKGTYIRTLAEHVGARIGAPAHLRALRRVSSGRFDLADAARIGALASEHAGARPDGKPRVRLRHAGGLVDAELRAHLEAALLSVDDAVPRDWCRLVLADPAAFARLVQGQQVDLPAPSVDAPSVDAAGEAWTHALVAGPDGAPIRVVARRDPGPRLRPVRVLDPGVPATGGGTEADPARPTAQTPPSTPADA